MKATTALRLTGAAAMVAALGACGRTPTEARATTLAEALGMDKAAVEAREAKVQEEVRRCMAEQGFEYVPVDPSRLHLQVRGPGGDDSSEFRRTQGYGITTGITGVTEQTSARPDGDDPNRSVREGLSEADREAYDRALFGAAAVGHDGGGGFSITVGPGPAGGGQSSSEAPRPEESGCFGKAQATYDAGAGLQRVGPELRDLQQRIASDARMVKADAAWSRCMGAAGYDFEKPDDVPPYLMGKLQELMGGGDDGGGGFHISGPPPTDSPELAALQREELALAKADDDCARRTGRREVAKKVRAEAERRFVEEHPDLGAANGAKG